MFRSEAFELTRNASNRRMISMDDSEFWRLDRVRNETGLCVSSIYEGMRDGWFPKNFAVTKQARAWLASEVKAWKAQKLAARARTQVAA